MNPATSSYLRSGASFLIQLVDSTDLAELVLGVTGCGNRRVR